jgi:hypothetical protein
LSVVSILFSVYWYVKSNLISDIRAILTECRQMPSWRDKSEDKLLGWMHDVGEHRLHRVSVFKLMKIKESLLEYEAVHVDILADEL